MDSQSAKTTSASEERGIYGGKTKGRKRHIVTDIMGNLLKIRVHAANIHDTKPGGGVFAAALEKYPSIQGVCADAAYRKTFAEEGAKLGRPVGISEKTKPEWEIPPKRWRIERTFSWLNHSRRLSKGL
jgi:transposase